MLANTISQSLPYKMLQLRQLKEDSYGKIYYKTQIVKIYTHLFFLTGTMPG